MRVKHNSSVLSEQTPFPTGCVIFPPDQRGQRNYCEHYEPLLQGLYSSAFPTSCKLDLPGYFLRGIYPG